MPVKVQITVPGMSIREKTYPDIHEAAAALGKTPETLRRWINNHSGYEPKGNDLMKRRVLLVGNQQARKVAKPKPRKERMTQEAKPDYFLPTIIPLGLLACFLLYIAV